MVFILTKKELGNLIKQARKIKSNKIQKQYTQKMLATDINKSQSYIGDIESGRTYPSFVILNKIAEACGVSIGFFQKEEKINNHIDKFIKLQLPNLDKKQLYEIREELKKDPDAKINYIYDYLEKNNTLISKANREYFNNLFQTPKDVIKFLLSQSVMINFCGIDINTLTESEISDLVNELLHQVKLISYKYNK